LGVLQTLPFHLIGVSHRTAGVGVRERLALRPGETAALLARGSSEGGPAVVLATCNRCEVYWYGDADHEQWFRTLAARGGEHLAGAVFRLQGEAAIRHLFQVAAGLDSQIVGEAEILQQVRRALAVSRSAAALPRPFEQAFTAAIKAGRRVRRETPLGRHPESVSGAAVRFARAHSGGSLENRTVLILGAGEAAAGVLHALREAPVGRIILINRNLQRARRLAERWGVTDVRQWNDRARAIPESDLVIAATAAHSPVISREDLAGAAALRNDRDLILLDLAVPRNIEPAAQDLAGLTLLDLDGLQERFCPVNGAISQTPMAAETLAQAQAIVEEELVRFDEVMRGRAAAPKLAELHRHAALLAAEEAERALARMPGLSATEEAAVREMAERLVKRVLYRASRAVRRADRREDGKTGSLLYPPSV
jgi:glutamyl-tRNA reductase